MKTCLAWLIAVPVAGFVVLVVIGLIVGPQPSSAPTSRVDEIRTGCAREFPDRPDEAERCLHEIVIREVIQQRRDKIERAADY